MRKVWFPVMVYLIKERSKRTNRITFRLKYWDTTTKEFIQELSRKLDFYAYGEKDLASFGKAEVERVKAQNDINQKGYKPGEDIIDFIVLARMVILTKSKASQPVFKAALQVFIDFVGKDSFPMSEMNTSIIETFKVFLCEEYPEGTTASTYLYKIKQFIDRAFDDGLIHKKIKFKGITEQSAPKEYLTEDEIKKLEDAPCCNPIIKLAFLFACCSGMRVSDWRRMKWNWILTDDDGEYILFFKMFKTKQQINNYVQSKAVEMLGEFKGKEELVFSDLAGYSYYYLNACLQSWLNVAGIDKHITTHCARVTFATRVYKESNGDIIAVQRALGHKNINTTMKYIRIPSKSMKDATLLKSVSKNALRPDNVDNNIDHNKNNSDQGNEKKEAA